MNEVIATEVFAGITLIAFVLGSVAIIRAALRPPMMLLVAGVASLVLAAGYVTLAALIRTSQHVGLWAPGLASSVPTALSAAGTTSVSVWVALWTANQSRISRFIADEAALIRELDGAIRLVDRRSAWLRDFWLGPAAPAVVAGQTILRKFRLGELNRTSNGCELFGPGSLAEEVVTSLFRGFPDRAVADQIGALNDAAKRLVVVEIQTGLPMQPLLGDLAFIGVVESCLADEVFHARGNDSPAQGVGDRGDATLRLQMLVVLAACFDQASQVEGSGRNLETAETLLSSQTHWWQEVFNSLAERPPRTAMQLRTRFGKAPLTAYEALRVIPDEECRVAENVWRFFILAPTKRNGVLDAIRALNPEQAKPRTFIELSHLMFWQRIRRRAGMEEDVLGPNSAIVG